MTAFKAGHIVCFGELLLRLSSPNSERLLQTPRFDTCCGGAEANVAVLLARFGHHGRLVTTVAANELGEACIGNVRGQGVDVSGVQRREGRMGLYFLESGALRRPSRVLYDRVNSAFASTGRNGYDWSKLLGGADWLHVSGITPAVGPGPAEAAIDAVKTAARCGVKVSFDGKLSAGSVAGVAR